MVIAAITGTPCIALSNYNQKVKGTYEWISHLNYIRFVENVDKIEAVVEELLSLENTFYDNSILMPYFDKIKKAMERE